MKIDVIYTFEGKEQQRATYPFVLAILKNKRTLIDFLFASLNPEEKGCLLKISTCILTPLAYPITNNYHKDKTHWFNKCKGKMWADDLEIYRRARGIKSTLSENFLNQFKIANT